MLVMHSHRCLHLSIALGAFVTLPNAQEAQRPDFWRVIERLTEDVAGAELASVLEHMATVTERRSEVGQHVARVDRALAEPWIPPALAADLEQRLAGPLSVQRGARFERLLADVAEWIDIEPSTDDELRSLAAEATRLADPDLKGLALLESLSGFLDYAHVLLDRALAGLEPEDWPLLFGGHRSFAEAWYRGHFPNTPLTATQRQDQDAFVKALLARPKTDRALVLGVANELMRLAEPDFVARLARRLARVREDVDADRWGDDVLAVVGDAPQNTVVLSGRKSSEHSRKVALVIDLGGDDSYARAAVVDAPDQLASIVLELGGDDTYAGDGPGPAYAAGGVALLVDRKGDDHYVSGRLGQAATALGVSALIDLAGQDRYEAEDYAQGHATCGVALLYDFEGDDSYRAWAFAQGGGIGYGLSALVDGDGNDRYVADGAWPDVYGNSGPDVFHGASQGYCTGVRQEVAGGVAALVDLGSGDDSYQAGSFSQGGGYYFSFGLMYDGGGDDENIGARYAQGFGVHQAIGVRWDAGGDDTYTCKSVAHTGMAWDEGVGYLIEDGGDDTYRTGALACGGAAQTGVAICIEGGGRDTYATGNASQGGTGSSEYHEKPALGVLIDLGGDADDYSAEGRADGTTRVTPGVEVFVDSKASTLTKALRRL